MIDKLEYKEKKHSKALKQFAESLHDETFASQDDTFHYDNVIIGSPSNQPLAEYEHLRRRIRTNTLEMWNYFSAELGKLRTKVVGDKPELAEQIKNILELGVEHKRSLINDQDRLRKVDGYEAWRHAESRDLSALVQKRFNILQNPKDCDSARKLVCKMSKGCGYGCQLHHLVYCMIMAYSTERTLVLKSKGWRYHRGGWEEIFQSVSDTCTDVDSVHAKMWPSSPATLVVNVPIIDSLQPRPSYLPLAIPADIAPRLKRLHGDPIVWWVGQFFKFLLRPQHNTQEMLNQGLEKLGWKKPIVGVHVRRTDKIGTEASLHELNEYMSHVEDYFRTLETNSNGTVIRVPRRVFLASDDFKVIEQARNQYPDYEILGDPEVAKTAGVSTRYTDNSLNGIIFDIHALSLCDYLVCTFSSQVCRVSYEIMQAMYPDASNRFKSLDDIYYFGGQNPHNRKVVIGHKGKTANELTLKPGDLVGIAGNHWDGWSKGKCKRTDENGLFPLFKTVDVVTEVDLPTYSEDSN